MTLQDLRIRHGLTQQDVAKQTGISYGTYRRYEYGEEFPKPIAICALAKLYGMPHGELFEELCREKGLFRDTTVERT